jgi:hypothetical protein
MTALKPKILSLSRPITRSLNKVYGLSHPKTSQNILLCPRDRLSSSI